LKEREREREREGGGEREGERAKERNYPSQKKNSMKQIETAKIKLIKNLTRTFKECYINKREINCTYKIKATRGKMEKNWPRT